MIAALLVVAVQQGAVPLPLATGAAIVQTLTFPEGDRESVHSVLRADSQGLLYQWSLVEVHAAGDTVMETFRYLESAADQADAIRLRLFHAKDDPEAHPGYTMHALSRALYRRLSAGRPDSVQVMSVDRPAGQQLAAFGLASRREVPVRWRGTFSPVGTERFSVLVNNRRVKVPALRLRGELTARQGRWTPEVWVLADSTYPLILKWIGEFRDTGNVLQTVRIDGPAGDLADPGGHRLAGELEGALSSACRTELPGIYFAFNSAALDPASDRTIAALAEVLQRHPAWTATLEGHTDSIGTGTANLALSERRVAAVRARLVDRHGIAGERLKVIGRGSRFPRETNETVEGRARNRRVEMLRECAKPGGDT